jgi:hypothetical protein
MGFSVRDDPKNVVDIAGRAWGEPVCGLALSVALKLQEDPDALPAISVAIHNRSAETQRLMTRGWLHFFSLSVINPDGAATPLTSYGAQLMKLERQPPLSAVTLAPGEAIEADIPIGAIYGMRPTGGTGTFRVKASCETPGGDRITSNEILVKY